MKNKFLKNLKNSLNKSGVKKIAVDEIIRVYDEYFKEGVRLGKNENEIYYSIENIDSIVKTFAPIKTNSIINREKRNLSLISLNAVILFFINLILIPILCAIFIIMFSIALIPIIATIFSIAFLLYGTTYINGHLIILSEITRWTLPFGIIGVSSLFTILNVFVFKAFFKFIAFIFSGQAHILRRYK